MSTYERNINFRGYITTARHSNVPANSWNVEIQLYATIKAYLRQRRYKQNKNMSGQNISTAPKMITELPWELQHTLNVYLQVANKSERIA